MRLPNPRNTPGVSLPMLLWCRCRILRLVRFSNVPGGMFVRKFAFNRSSWRFFRCVNEFSSRLVMLLWSRFRTRTLLGMFSGICDIPLQLTKSFVHSHTLLQAPETNVRYKYGSSPNRLCTRTHCCKHLKQM